MSRSALPVRSPYPLSVPCTWTTPASTAASELATAQPVSLWQWMPSGRRRRLAHGVRRRRRRSVGQHAAVGVAQRDDLGAGLDGGARRPRRRTPGRSGSRRRSARRRGTPGAPRRAGARRCRATIARFSASVVRSASSTCRRCALGDQRHDRRAASRRGPGPAGRRRPSRRRGGWRRTPRAARASGRARSAARRKNSVSLGFAPGQPPSMNPTPRSSRCRAIASLSRDGEREALLLGAVAQGGVVDVEGHRVSSLVRHPWQDRRQRKDPSRVAKGLRVGGRLAGALTLMSMVGRHHVRALPDDRHHARPADHMVGRPAGLPTRTAGGASSMPSPGARRDLVQARQRRPAPRCRVRRPPVAGPSAAHEVAYGDDRTNSAGSAHASNAQSRAVGARSAQLVHRVRYDVPAASRRHRDARRRSARRHRPRTEHRARRFVPASCAHRSRSRPPGRSRGGATLRRRPTGRLTSSRVRRELELERHPPSSSGSVGGRRRPELPVSPLSAMPVHPAVGVLGAAVLDVEQRLRAAAASPRPARRVGRRASPPSQPSRPTGVTTAAVPQANTSVISPAAHAVPPLVDGDPALLDLEAEVARPASRIESRVTPSRIVPVSAGVTTGRRRGRSTGSCRRAPRPTCCSTASRKHDLVAAVLGGLDLGDQAGGVVAAALGLAGAAAARRGCTRSTARSTPA